jgi:hypothetical protein
LFDLRERGKLVIARVNRFDLFAYVGFNRGVCRDHIPSVNTKAAALGEKSWYEWLTTS